MRRTGLALPLLLALQLVPGPGRADVVCTPGDPQSNSGTYPGSTQRYQGRLQRLEGGLQSSYQSGSSAGQALPGNPNCSIVRHATVDNGVPCKGDRDCQDKRCRPFPDGNKYCMAEQKSCTLPGRDGVPGGAVVGIHQQCYECAPGIGWKLCGETGKQALQSNQDGVVVRQGSGSDEPSREDWRSRRPVTSPRVNTDSPGSSRR